MSNLFRSKSNLNVIFILVLLSALLRFTDEIQLFLYQLLIIEVNYLFLIFAVVLKCFVLLFCYFLFMQSEKSPERSIVIPALTILFSAYFMFFQRYNLVTILDSDIEVFDLLISSSQLKTAFYLNKVITILIYVLVFISGTINSTSKDTNDVIDSKF